MHLFPLYIPGNTLKHPSECSILKVVFKIVLGGHVESLDSRHTFSAHSVHPTTSHIILPRGLPSIVVM